MLKHLRVIAPVVPRGTADLSKWSLTQLKSLFQLMKQKTDGPQPKKAGPLAEKCREILENAPDRFTRCRH